MSGKVSRMKIMARHVGAIPVYDRPGVLEYWSVGRARLLKDLNAQPEA
jgi:hypothetical protein